MWVFGFFPIELGRHSTTEAPPPWGAPLLGLPESYLGQSRGDAATGANRRSRGQEDQDARSGRVVHPGQASLIFFNSRRQSVRKLSTVRLSLDLSGSTPN